MSGFHKLTVQEVRPLTPAACSVRFAVPEELRADYAFHPGQHLTLRRVSGADDERRTYSICSTPAELAERGELRIGVKRINGGLFSSWLNGELAAGDTVEVMTPAGRFGAGTGRTDSGVGRRLRHHPDDVDHRQHAAARTGRRDLPGLWQSDVQ